MEPKSHTCSRSSVRPWLLWMVMAQASLRGSWGGVQGADRVLKMNNV